MVAEELNWKAAADLKGIYELRTVDTVVARIASINETKIVGSVENSNVPEIWLFEIEEALFSPTVKIINPKTKVEIGKISLGMLRNGEIEIGIGAKYKWTHPGWSSSDRVLNGSDGEKLLTFELDDSEKAEISVGLKIEEKCLSLGDKWLLIILGWALIVREKNEAGTKKLASGNPQEFSDKVTFAKALNIEIPIKQSNVEINEIVQKSESGKNKPEKLDTETLGETVVDGFVEYGFDFIADIFK